MLFLITLEKIKTWWNSETKQILYVAWLIIIVQLKLGDIL